MSAGGAMNVGTMLTARQVVEQLDRLGLGVWSPDAVIKWTLEEPALQIALRAQQGKPHRYRMVDVLEFHLQRCRKERAKGFTSGDPDLEARLERALRLLVTGEAPSAPPPVPQTPLMTLEGLSAASSAADSLPNVDAPAAVSPAKGEGEQQQLAWDQMSESEALLAVLQGRDPRNWKAAEEAVKMRRNRLVEERRLIPVEELDEALDAHTEHTRTTLQAAGPSIKLTLRDQIPAELREKVDRVIDDAIQRLLETLARTDDLDDADESSAAA